MTREKLLTQIGGASFLIGIGFIFQAGGDIFLARHLNAADYGYFTLVFRDTVNIISMLVLFGLDSSLIRYVGVRKVSSFVWPGFLRSTIVMFAFSAALLCFPLKLLYNVPFPHYVLEIIIITIIAATSLSATFLRIEGLIGAAQLSLQLWRIFFPLLIVGVFFLFGSFNTFFLAAILAASVCISGAYCGFRLSSIPKGRDPIYGGQLLAEGFLFFGLSASSLAMIRIERFFLGGLGTLADVGAYYAVSLSIVTVFSIASSGLSYVLLPHFARGGIIQMKKNLLRLLLLGTAISLPFALAGKEILHLLFRGRYDDYDYLVPYLLATGIVQLLYLLPSTFIGGKAGRGVLKQFLFFGVLSLTVNIVLCIVLIPQFGLRGAAISTLSSWLVRLGSGLWFTYFVPHNLRTSPPA